MLCGLVERVRNAVLVFRMLMSRLSGECHAEVAPHRLPGGESGIAKKEPQQQQHIDANAAARAAVIVAAAVVAARATRTGRTGTNIPSTGALIQKANLPAAPAEPAATAADQYWGLSSRKREALSGTHSSTSGLAGPWVPALRCKAASAGMTAMGCLRLSLHSAPA
jgi:hypothetical protein